MMGTALERHAVGRDLPAVREKARELAAASVSANTRRAYEGAFRRLRDWLAGRPFDDATLAEYLAARFEAGHSPAVAGQVVAAVRFYAKLGDQPSPVGPATERVLAGFRREGRARGPGQVVGVRWEQADAAAAVAGSSGGSARGLRDAALLAVMSDGLLRVSEAAGIEVADLEAEGANTLTIRRSKTDQEGEGAGPVHRRADGGTGPRVARRRRDRRRADVPAPRQGREATRPTQHRVHSGHHPATRRRGRGRGPRVRPLATGRRGAVPGRRRGLGRRDADRRPMAIPLDARPLCQGPARRPRRGGQAPLRGVETR